MNNPKHYKRSIRRQLFLAIAVVILMIAVVLAVKALFSLFPVGITVKPKEQGPFIICIDPGHGGSDVGAVSLEGRQEKDDVFAFALALEEKLTAMIAALPEEADEEIQVILTRDKDVYLTLEERYTYANEQNAGIFVSIHRNSGGGKGVEVWIQNNASKEEKHLGQTLLDNLVRCPVNGNRGLRYGTPANSEVDFAVNKGTLMPACLVELGFIDHEGDNLLFDEQFDAYVQAIAEGILELCQ